MLTVEHGISRKVYPQKQGELKSLHIGAPQIVVLILPFGLPEFPMILTHVFLFTLGRMWHTAVQGIDVGETVIFGGCSNNLLNPEERSVHSRKVITLSFSPISLSR